MNSELKKICFCNTVHAQLVVNFFDKCLENEYDHFPVFIIVNMSIKLPLVLFFILLIIAYVYLITL